MNRERVSSSNQNVNTNHNCAFGSNENLNMNHDRASSCNDNHCSGIEHETIGGSEFWIPEIAAYVKPTIGLTFSSLERAIAFYKRYVLLGGFDFRKGTSTLSNNGMVNLKYLLCSKEGFKLSKSFDSLQDKQPRRSNTRTGCNACVKFRRFGDGNSYIIYFFEEKHNHKLVSVADNHLLKQCRHLDYLQKSFIVNVSNANIGASVAHKVMKELTGSYENVGGTVADFKNFNKDLNCFIGESDAQMTVDKMLMKVEDVPGFSFEYKCNENHRLTGMFWAHRKAKQNYKAYGDVISFDATFKTNKYNMVFVPFTGVDKNKRCVSFGVGLLASETIDSYTWLLKAFLKSLDNEPRLVVTDQDPAMKQAIVDVFPNSRHRLCMWHIMKKLKDKVPSNVYNESDFSERFNHIVWNATTDPTNFEEKWLSIVQEYKLQNNKWLCDLFDIRERWIPAYFRDLPMSGLMRTKSRSESENYFFGRFSHPCSMLVRFMGRFEAAIDKQRSMQRTLDHKTRTTTPVFKTSRKIERHAAKLYTRTIFYEVQNEIYESVVSCSQVSFIVEHGQKIRIIEEKDEQMKVKGQYKVVSDATNGRITCRCMKYVRFGILCRHMFCALWLSGVVEIPSEYIANRWTMDAEEVDLLDMNLECTKDDCGIVLNDVYSTVRYSLSRVSIDKDRLLKYQEQLHILKNEIDADFLEEPTMSLKETMESLLGVSNPDVVTVQVPQGIRNKGCGSRGKRLSSDFDKAIAKHSRPKRLCKECGEYGHHDSRNCPTKNKDE